MSFAFSKSLTSSLLLVFHNYEIEDSVFGYGCRRTVVVVDLRLIVVVVNGRLITEKVV